MGWWCLLACVQAAVKGEAGDEGSFVSGHEYEQVGRDPAWLPSSSVRLVGVGRKVGSDVPLRCCWWWGGCRR